MKTAEGSRKPLISGPGIIFLSANKKGKKFLKFVPLSELPCSNYDYSGKGKKTPKDTYPLFDT